VPDVAGDYVDGLSFRQYRLKEMYRESSDSLWHVDRGNQSEHLDPLMGMRMVSGIPVDFNSTRENLSRYDIHYAVMSNFLDMEGEQGYTGTEMNPPYKFSWFFNSLPEKRYVVYRNDHHAFYWVG